MLKNKDALTDNSKLTELYYMTWSRQSITPVSSYPFYYEGQHLAEDFVYFADLPEEQEELTIDE